MTAAKTARYLCFVYYYRFIRGLRGRSELLCMSRAVFLLFFFFFKQKTAYEIGLGFLLNRSSDLQVAIQNRVASNIGISQSTFSVKVLNLFSRSRRKTNKRKSKHSAMLRNKETRHRMFIGLLNTTRKLA